MGMYTELNISVRFKTGTPQHIIDAIALMVNPSTEASGESMAQESDRLRLSLHESIRELPLFHTERWTWMMRSSGSYYFDSLPHVEFVLDDNGNNWYLTLHTDIKNYSGEWEKLLDFIAPYVERAEHGPQYIGTYRYEEDEHPTLVYILPNGTCSMVSVSDAADAALALEDRP